MSRLSVRLAGPALLTCVTMVAVACEDSASNPVAPTATNSAGSSGFSSTSSSDTPAVVGALGQSKDALCHRTEGTNGFVPITIADPAVDTHIAHGDMYVGDPVPGHTGMVFDGNCHPITPSVTYSFTGYLSDDFGTLRAGTPFSGSFTYNPVQTGTIQAVGTVYEIASASLSVGTESPNVDLARWVTLVTNDSTVFPPLGSDQWGITNFNVDLWTLGGLTLGVIDIVFADATGAVFDDETLPVAGLQLSDFTSATFRINGSDRNPPYTFVDVESPITSLTFTSLP